MSNGYPQPLPVAIYHFSLDGVEAGDLTVEQKDVLEPRRGGNLNWIAGDVLGRRFYGTYAEDTHQFRIRVPVFGTYHWTFGGVLQSRASDVCSFINDQYDPPAGFLYYEFLDAEYSIMRIIVKTWLNPNQPDQIDRVAGGTWYAWTCAPGPPSL